MTFNSEYNVAHEIKQYHLLISMYVSYHDTELHNALYLRVLRGMFNYLCAELRYVCKELTILLHSVTPGLVISIL